MYFLPKVMKGHKNGSEKCFALHAVTWWTLKKKQKTIIETNQAFQDYAHKTSYEASKIDHRCVNKQVGQRQF